MPPSFTYVGKDEAVGQALNYIAFGGATRQSKLAEFGLTAGAGLKSITGIGFQPECVILFGSISELDTLREGARWHLGVATGPTEQWTIGYAANDNVSPNQRTGVFYDDKMIGVGVIGSLVSLDADGFTLNITSGHSAAIPIPMVYLALRGGGSYKAGVATVPAATGNRSVSVGFPPDCVFIASTRKVANGESPDMSISLGAGDGTREFSAWAGADQQGPNTGSYQEPGKIVTIGRVDNTIPITLAELRAQAELSALGASDFTLDWTLVDGAAYKFGWLAVENAATDRFIYDPAGDVVPTPIGPKALLGFGNSLTPAQDADFTSGAAIAVSACDEFLLERSASVADYDAPIFSVIQNSRFLSRWCFGCQPGVHAGGVGAVGALGTEHDCDIVAFEQETVERIYDVVSMQWRSAVRKGQRKVNVRR